MVSDNLDTSHSQSTHPLQFLTILSHTLSSRIVLFFTITSHTLSSYIFPFLQLHLTLLRLGVKRYLL